MVAFVAFDECSADSVDRTGRRDRVRRAAEVVERPAEIDATFGVRRRHRVVVVAEDERVLHRVRAADDLRIDARQVSGRGERPVGLRAIDAGLRGNRIRIALRRRRDDLAERHRAGGTPAAAPRFLVLSGGLPPDRGIPLRALPAPTSFP